MARPLDTIPYFDEELDQSPDSMEPYAPPEFVPPVEQGPGQFEFDMFADARQQDDSDQMGLGPIVPESEELVAPEEVAADAFQQDMGAQIQLTDELGEPEEFGLDAISGGQAESPAPYVEGQDDTPILPEEYEQQIGEIPIDELTPDQLAIRALEDQQAATAERQRLVDDEMRDNAQRELENRSFLKDSQEKHLAQIQQIVKESKEIGQMKIDPDRWYSSAGAGRKIGTWVSVLAGGQLGLLSGRGGNAGLDFVMGEINKDIDAQKASIANQSNELTRRQGLVSEIYQATGDMFRAEETARLSAIEGMAGRIQSEMAKLDPEGTQAMEKQALLQELDSRRAQSLSALEEKGHARAIEDAEFEMKARDSIVTAKLNAAKMAKINAETKKLNRRGTGRSKPKGPTVSTLLSAAKANLRWDPSIGDFVQKVPSGAAQGETIDQARLREAKGRADKMELDLSGTERSRKLGTRVFDSNGDEILAADATQAKTAKRAQADLDTVTKLVDELKIITDEEGWQSDTVKSAAWQKAKGKLVNILLVNKDNFELGALSGDDMKIMEEFQGGDDATAYISMMPGLLSMQQNLESQYNSRIGKLAPVGTTAKYYHAPRMRKATATERTDAELQGDILSPRLKNETPEKYLKNREADVGVWLKRKPTREAMTELMRGAAAQLDHAGRMDLAKKMSKQWKREAPGPSIMGVKTSDLGQNLAEEFGEKTLEDPQAIYDQMINGDGR